MPRDIERLKSLKNVKKDEDRMYAKNALSKKDPITGQPVVDPNNPVDMSLFTPVPIKKQETKKGGFGMFGGKRDERKPLTRDIMFMMI